MFYENKDYNSIKIISHHNKNKKNNIITDIKYDSQEEFNNLNDFNTLPWTNAQDDFSENNFNFTDKIEAINHLNKIDYNQKEKENISPKLNDDDNEERINVSFNQDINSNFNDFTKSTYLKKKRKNNKLNILTPIQEVEFENKKNKKEPIFKIEKTNNQKMELFEKTKLNVFSPLFRIFKQEKENTFKLKKKLIFKEIHHTRKKTLFKKIKLSDSLRDNKSNINKF